MPEGTSTGLTLASLRGALRFDRGRATSSGDGAVTKSAFPDDVASGTPEHGTADDPNYYQKLTTLFPAEALAIYGTGTAIFGTANVVVVAVGLVVLLTLRIVANQEASGPKVDWRAVVVAVVSYLLWATANDAHWLASIVHPASNGATEVRHYAALFGAALVFLAPVLAPAPVKAER